MYFSIWLCADIVRYLSYHLFKGCKDMSDKYIIYIFIVQELNVAWQPWVALVRALPNIFDSQLHLGWELLYQAEPTYVATGTTPD